MKKTMLHLDPSNIPLVTHEYDIIQKHAITDTSFWKVEQRIDQVISMKGSLKQSELIHKHLNWKINTIHSKLKIFFMT